MRVHLYEVDEKDLVGLNLRKELSHHAVGCIECEGASELGDCHAACILQGLNVVACLAAARQGWCKYARLGGLSQSRYGTFATFRPRTACAEPSVT